MTPSHIILKTKIKIKSFYFISQGYLVFRFLCISEKSGIGVPSYRGSVGSENPKFRKTKSSCEITPLRLISEVFRDKLKYTRCINSARFRATLHETCPILCRTFCVFYAKRSLQSSIVQIGTEFADKYGIDISTIKPFPKRSSGS